MAAALVASIRLVKRLPGHRYTGSAPAENHTPSSPPATSAQRRPRRQAPRLNARASSRKPIAISFAATLHL